MTTNRSNVIGIDLGTYNSAACVLMGGEPLLLRPEEGATDQGMCFPSVVEFDDSGEFIQVGELARRSLPVHPQSVVWGVKRLIGRPYKAAEASGDIERYGYRIERDADGGCAIQVGPQTFSPREITTRILQKIKRDAEADFNPIGQTISEAVITVPAYFDPVQKHETEAAARDAGFEKVYLLPESTAAASAYRLSVEKENQYVAVIDFGAGTLDVTIALLYLDENGQLQTVEKSHGGDTALGGLDMDDAIVQIATRRSGLKKLLKDPQAKARLRTELERAKIDLSTAQETEVAFTWRGGPVKFSLTRDQLEQAVGPVVERCRGPIRLALEEANLEPEDVTHVLLVGGPTMMPIVRRTIMEEFISNPQVVEELKAIDSQGFAVNPMEAVARGAVLGSVGKIAPHGYGLLLAGEYEELLPRRQRYPSSGTMQFGYWGSERTIDFGLVRHAVNPEDLREEYTLLGMFQFDCVPNQGTLHCEMNWEYTDNGVLQLEVCQLGTGVSLPLYDISRLEGHKIAKPARPIPQIMTGVTASAGVTPSATVNRQSWSPTELENAVQFGKQVVGRARERVEQASGEQREKILELCSQLEGWMQNETIDSNHRTPHIRDLGRALMSLLYVSRLIDSSEVASLQQGL
jgi:molecular chaperone DnaK